MRPSRQKEDSEIKVLDLIDREVKELEKMMRTISPKKHHVGLLLAHELNDILECRFHSPACLDCDELYDVEVSPSVTVYDCGDFVMFVYCVSYMCMYVVGEDTLLDKSLLVSDMLVFTLNRIVSALELFESPSAKIGELIRKLISGGTNENL